MDKRLFNILADDRRCRTSPQDQRDLLDNAHTAVRPFYETLSGHGTDTLLREVVRTLQVNVGKLCNQTCAHCHVDAGPSRREIMSAETIAEVIDFLGRSLIDTLDITGGAPEMNPHFQHLVTSARRLGKRVIDRCNLTILMAPGYRDLPNFLRSHRVHLIASLPCYLEDNCDAQRGRGVFEQSIAALRRLNELGYGADDSNLKLDLVYNPQGTALAPRSLSLEDEYKSHLSDRYGVHFNSLLTMNNMPISRFLEHLVRTEQLDNYLEKLSSAFNPATIHGLMCRWMVSVDWQGYLFDCDFNQMLEMHHEDHQGRLHIRRATDEIIEGLRIKSGNHCYGCAAGCGSSCSGALCRETKY